MLLFVKVLAAAIVTRSLFLGNHNVNGFNVEQDRVLSSNGEDFPSTLGELEHEDDTLSIRKLLQTSGTNGPWTTTQKLTAGDGAAEDYFGSSIALNGSTLVVGAPYDDASGSYSGSVYVFEKSNGPGMSWTQTAKLTAGDGAANDEFGWSVALDGTALVVGSFQDDDRGSGSGSVYVFEKSNVQGIPWTQSAKLTAGDGVADDNFGWLVALEGTTLAVGAPSVYGSGSGSAYVFESKALLPPPPPPEPTPSGPPLPPPPSPTPPPGSPPPPVTNPLVYEFSPYESIGTNWQLGLGCGPSGKCNSSQPAYFECELEIPNKLNLLKNTIVFELGDNIYGLSVGFDQKSRLFGRVGKGTGQNKRKTAIAMIASKKIPDFKGKIGRLGFQVERVLLGKSYGWSIRLYWNGLALAQDAVSSSEDSWSNNEEGGYLTGYGNLTQDPWNGYPKPFPYSSKNSVLKYVRLQDMEY